MYYPHDKNGLRLDENEGKRLSVEEPIVYPEGWFYSPESEPSNLRIPYDETHAHTKNGLKIGPICRLDNSNRDELPPEMWKKIISETNAKILKKRLGTNEDEVITPKNSLESKSLWQSFFMFIKSIFKLD